MGIYEQAIEELSKFIHFKRSDDRDYVAKKLSNLLFIKIDKDNIATTGLNAFRERAIQFMGQELYDEIIEDDPLFVHPQDVAVDLKVLALKYILQHIGYGKMIRTCSDIDEAIAKYAPVALKEELELNISVSPMIA